MRGSEKAARHCWRNIPITLIARSPPNAAVLKLQFPGLSRKILPEAVMLFFADDLETCLFVDVSRCVQNALRPQCHLLVPGLPREADTFRNEPLANSQPTRLPVQRAADAALRLASDSLATKTAPTLSPSFSATQARSRFGS